MAARGTEAKKEIFTKVMSVFPEAFWEDEGKILRIPYTEGGNLLEVKMSLTAAKNILGNAATSAFELAAPTPAKEEKEQAPWVDEVTTEEKENVDNLLKALGL